MFGSQHPLREQANLPVSFFRNFSSNSPTKTGIPLQTPTSPLTQKIPEKDRLRTSPSKKSPCKENSPSKKVASPFKVYKPAGDSPKKTLTPFIPDRQSPTKQAMLLCKPLDSIAVQPVQTMPTLLTNRDHSEDVKDLLALDVPILSFGRFISGKTLGAALELTNKSKQERTYELAIPSGEIKQTSAQLLANFYPEDLPYEPKTSLPKNYSKCFFVEDPQTRLLSAKIKVTLAPGQTQTVVIVLKTPMLNKADMLCMLKITHGTYTEKDLENSVRRQRDNSMFLPLVGRLENPVVRCIKSIFDIATQHDIVPLAVQSNVPVQKFKIPFRSSNQMEDPFEFMFIKSVRTGDNDDMCAVFDCMVFFCQPSVLHLSSEPGVLNVQIKLDVERLSQLPSEVLKRPCNKLLIARLKDTNLLQSFFVTINLIEGALE